ncbi:hypothetical protein Bcav_1045 [Beutenbergia cavernae DSM 12333]|uniref:Uncharacterized protein n=1 Tax=Beutenbergia cavernae (strain ATCC BAA-8 / DSM 12333 / CCUG 43141 / JCM 11478 / NBRC 16432 / NCIMB 13614 / HKI 0122) TaxID=471853 RepID=C5C0C0_BEUC1|nr:hypothetical protein [Beutenbergia cavernae]ACQ79306.1 hypothetical protein Bcav_1045 [Beutenbergia cavernae DSM 12333]
MSENALVAGPTESSALGGTMLIESLADLSTSLESGSWLDVGLAGLSTALDTAAAVMDPLGQLIAAGLGWLMEHVEPLKGWLNDLTGDANAVAGFAATWTNVAGHLGTASEDLRQVVRSDLEAMTGQGVEAYARYADDVAAHLKGLSGSSAGVAAAIEKCGMVVQIVHDMVRDAIAELVGAAISWAAQIVFTVGLGTPWVIGQVTTRVSSLAARVGGSVTAVIRSASSLRGLVDTLKEAISGLARNLRSNQPRTPGAPGTRDVPGHFAGGSYGPGRRRGELPDEWAERAYDDIRADPNFADDLARANPDMDPADIRRALDHVFRDEHLLGGRTFPDGSVEPITTGRFDPDSPQAEAFYRLRNGEGTPTDHLLLRHEIAESAYVRDHPGATYLEAHEHANSIADWHSARMREGS